MSDDHSSPERRPYAPKSSTTDVVAVVLFFLFGSNCRPKRSKFCRAVSLWFHCALTVASPNFFVRKRWFPAQRYISGIQ